MEEHDDWKLGDEDDGSACTRCGKRNRSGLAHCVICGTRLGNELETDPGSLRTIGEAMGKGRRSRAGANRRRSFRAWSIAAVALVLTVAALTWLETREQPFRLEDLTATPTPLRSPARDVPPTVRPAAVVVPPRPTSVRTMVPPPPPQPAATVAARVVAPPRPTSQPTRQPTVVRPLATPPPAPPTAPPVTATPVEVRPQVEATEKPSLGSDLQDATRAYRHAVDLHNERVDDYNAIADEIQRRDAWDDSEQSVELRRRLEGARGAVEGARVYAETLRVRMESVRARYR